jgi:signal transduction histidine kinase
MAAPRARGNDGTMLFAIVLALTIGCIAFILARESKPAAGGGQVSPAAGGGQVSPAAGGGQVSPAAGGGQVSRVLRPDGLRRRIRARGWGLLLLPVAMAAAMMAGGAHGLIPAELGVAVLAIVFAPKLAAKLVPYGVLGLAVFGFMLAKTYRDGNTSQVQYLFVHAGPDTWDGGIYPPVLAEAGVLLVVGLWLLLRLDAPGAGLVKALAARWLASGRRGISGPQALLLIPVVGLAMQLLGPGNWFGFQAVDGLDVALIDLAVATATLVLIFRSRAWATTLAAAGLLVLGGYGWLIAVFWPAVPGFAYGVSDLHNNLVPAPLWTDALQGSLLLALGLWLAPRVTRHHLADAPDPELAARARQLTQRVQTLTQTRHDAVDTATAELRRIERDLHDGAQARLVALGMSLRAAERMFASNPEAALALVTEARETSSRALTDLRDLVRGIYPPVLADRGLADAVRALALDTPLHTELDIDLPSTVDMPVGAAVYFAVAEALANAVQHSGARTVRIHLSHSVGMLRAQVTDDGAGGADPARGTGVAGVERRLATFDGILALSSPPGGPTIVAIEVPCALSSAKTSSS